MVAYRQGIPRQQYVLYQHYLDEVVGKESIVRVMDALLNPFSEILGNEKEVIIEMLEFRRVLETEIACLAAERRTEEDLKNIENSIKRMKTDISQGGTGLVGDTDFHTALALASHNSVFQKMLSMAKELLIKTRETTLKIEGQPEKSLNDHLLIYEAIKSGNCDLSKNLMLEHIRKAQENVLETLRNGT